MSLNWLPIRFRVEYKIAVICFKCINGLAPIYLKNILEIYKPTRALRSAQDNLILKKPIMNYKSYGVKIFLFLWSFCLELFTIPTKGGQTPI